MLFFLLYAVSPIDFIPDFIPIIGLFDDLIILSLGIWLCRKMTPESIWTKNYGKLKNGVKVKTKYKIIGTLLILAIWALIITLIVFAIV